jgi:hypothetical protein
MVVLSTVANATQATKGMADAAAGLSTGRAAAA